MDSDSEFQSAEEGDSDSDSDKRSCQPQFQAALVAVSRETDVSHNVDEAKVDSLSCTDADFAPTSLPLVPLLTVSNALEQNDQDQRESLSEDIPDRLHEAQEAEVEEPVDESEDADEATGDGWDDWDVDPAELVTPREELPPSAFPSVGAAQSTAAGESPRPAALWTGWNSIISAVGEGFSNVLETVETGLGAPTPDDLARLTTEERLRLNRKADELKEQWPETDHDDCDSAADEALSDGGSDAGGVGSEEASSGYQSDGARSRDVDPVNALAALTGGGALSGLFAGVTTTGKSLVSGSLDVLESLGKKTFDVLTVADHADHRRRFILSQERPNLSKTLRELKSRSEQTPSGEESFDQVQQVNYASLFENYEGMVNLEGLEMLSENCRRQLRTAAVAGGERRLDDIALAFADMDSSATSSLCDDSLDAAAFADQLRAQVDRLAVAFNPGRLIEVTAAACQHSARRAAQAQRSHAAWLDEQTDRLKGGGRVEVAVWPSLARRRIAVARRQELHERALHCQAQTTARAVEMLHKCAQLLLVAGRHADADAFASLATLLCDEISSSSGRFSQCLNTAAEMSGRLEVVGDLLTSIFLEANNSANYVRESVRLLRPVLELLAVQSD